MASIQELTAPPAKGSKTVLLFWAPWHEDSVSLKDSVLPALAAAGAQEVAFATVAAEDFAEISDTYNVTMVPTFCFLDETGATVDRIEGQVEIAQVTQAVQRLANSSSSSSTESKEATNDAVTKKEAPEAPSLDDRLKRLINSSQVMLFMKGVPSDPRCGFSRQAIEMLNESKVSFGSFDILSDEEVRQGLKKYSDWPTYPQIYANGELVGGLDILKEMQQDGEEPLAAQLGVKPQLSLNERLEALVKRQRIMVFMKGVPSAPRCGFSRQIVEMLNEQSVAYDAFDILGDEEVRQGLKAYSDWPTYPQLYVDGELVGGLDIVKEMAETDDLKDLLKGGS